MRIEWHDGLVLGHPKIDAQHRMLVNLLNRFVDSFDAPPGERDSRIRNAFASISVFTELHFAMEERLMDEASYPDAATHIRGHWATLADISRVNELFTDPDFRPEGLLREANLWSTMISRCDPDDLKLAQFLADRQRPA